MVAYNAILARAALPKNEGCMDAEIVLVHLRTTPRGEEYVTWQHNVQFGDHDGFYWGHYFHDDQAAARADFIERCQRWGAL